MSYQVLARKYRPLRFSDVIGQDHVTRTLLNALAQDRIAHGYIFSGHRGIGKTTIARILASALNCRNAIGSAPRPTPEPCNACESCLEIRAGNAVDVIEIDAATNRGIDEIRELRDAARYRPARDRFKIYILDEAHQITDAAFNALLKTLEEPPEHIVFMMATTQPEDIPQTIRSRCQHFSFHAVKLDDIVGQLRAVSTQESITVDDAPLALLAEAGDGSMRDALSIMDQAIASAPQVEGRPSLSIEQVRELMGTVSNAVFEQVLEAVHANSSADVLATVNRLLDAGNGAPQLARQFVRFLRNCIVAKITGLSPDAQEQDVPGLARDLLQISPAERARAARAAAVFTEEELSRFLAIMLRTFDELGYRQEQRFHLELGLLKLVHVQRLVPVEEILSQLGAPSSAKPASPATGVPSSPARMGGNTSVLGAPPSPAVSSPAKVGSSQTQSSTISTPSSRPTPFEADRSRKTPTASTASEVSTGSTAGSLALAEAPLPSTVIAERPHLVSALAPEAEELVQAQQSTVPSPDFDLNALQAACVSALEAAKGQSSAAHTIEEAAFTLAGDTVEVQTTLSSTMLPLGINAGAQKLLNTTLREHAPGLKLKLLPGTPANKAQPKQARAPRSGSAEELAAKHPLVQQAKQLFGAEISNVIDLRDKT